MLKQRLLIAIPLTLLLILIIFLPGMPGKIIFSAAVILALFMALYEGFTLLQCENNKPFLFLTGVYGIALIFNTMRYHNIVDIFIFENILTFLFLLAIFAIAVCHAPTQKILKNVLTSLALSIYICWTLSYIPKIYCLLTDGAFLLFAMIVICKMSDIGGYFIGSITAKMPNGNHKMCKLVSPKKSWEGLIGGILFSMATTGLFYYFNFANGIFTRNSIFVLGITIPIIGLLGDLMESVIKRCANAKDSGNIPGLGGILDILDSIIPTAPFFFYYIMFCLR
ncbi:MAG: phosphatidate cytidylyltransferase [Lentisphaeria bacterium]